MPASMIRIRPTSHQTLKEMAALTGNSLQDELEKAILQRQRMLYLEGLQADYAAIEQDPKAMIEWKKEIEMWDTTANDGLENL